MAGSHMVGLAGGPVMARAGWSHILTWTVVIISGLHVVAGLGGVLAWLHIITRFGCIGAMTIGSRTIYRRGIDWALVGLGTAVAIRALVGLGAAVAIRALVGLGAAVAIGALVGLGTAVAIGALVSLGAAVVMAVTLCPSSVAL